MEHRIGDERILRLIPGLERAEFLRYGQIHRNTYLNSPHVLSPDLSLRVAPEVFIAGQLSGVEGYVECIASGFLAGWSMASRLHGRCFVPPPRVTAVGSLLHYVTHADPRSFQPANMSFDLLPSLDDVPRRPNGSLAIAQQVFDVMPDKPEIIPAATSEPAYNRGLDRITLPHLSQFESAAAYFETLYHEAVHSTGSKKRLNRFSEVEGDTAP